VVISAFAAPSAPRLAPLPAEDAGLSRVQRAWAVLDGVPDPEVPAVSVRDLGIVRDVRLAGEALDVVLTPTYSGCPATEVIEHDVLAAIEAAGLGPARVTLQRAPAWTTEWITEQGRARLLAYGIAPPGPLPPGTEVPLRFMPRANAVAPALACPRCGSLQTERLSAFGSTACKALYRCMACREPFEHFKPL
jgi:ring-1,2-phenylacetyl-CoA epoxidase subunit PaaD